MAAPSLQAYDRAVIPRFLGQSFLLWTLLLPDFPTAFAESAWLRATRGDSVIQLQVHGSDESDWFIQVSSNLLEWEGLNTPPLWSKPKVPPVRNLPVGESKRFFRTTPTSGLFETNVVRHIELTFAETNWATILSNLYPSSSNLPARLVMDNGIDIPSVGVRFKGFSSYDYRYKKSFNIEVSAYDPAQRLLGLKTINLNNLQNDSSFLREPLYLNIFSEYAPSPRGSVATLIVNGVPKGVFALAEQENSDLIRRYFPTAQGDRWRTHNLPTTNSAFTYLGTNAQAYTNHYDLKSGNPTNAWPRLINAITALTTDGGSWDSLDTYFAIDSWIWFFALENIFADLDSHLLKGADFSFYYEVESGRIHPIQHDGSEVMQEIDYWRYIFETNRRPLLSSVLATSELRQRYIAHVRTILNQSFAPRVIFPAINAYTNTIWSAVLSDTNRSGRARPVWIGDLKYYLTNRYNIVSSNSEILLKPPSIGSVGAVPLGTEGSGVSAIRAQVLPGDTNGIASVWLYWRDKHFGRFSRRAMFDDGDIGDAVAGDGIFTGRTEDYPPNTVVQFYIEARSGNAEGTSSFSPERADRVTYSYRVALSGFE